MSYKYREVFCPLFEKRFMWLKLKNDKANLGYYIDSETGGKAGREICTSCKAVLIVFDGVFEGKIPEGCSNMRFVREYGI